VAGNEAFDALADPVRREILHFLSGQDEASAGQIAERIGSVGRTAVSSHLRVLRTSQLVKERKEGRNRFYSLHADGPVRDVLAFLEGLLNTSLDGLSRAMESSQGTSGEGRRAM
jgi:DNA-binding transcriptional ArsR family regulator